VQFLDYNYSYNEKKYFQLWLKLLVETKVLFISITQRGDSREIVQKFSRQTRIASVLVEFCAHHRRKFISLHQDIGGVED
jgi:hypothetical protein